MKELITGKDTTQSLTNLDHLYLQSFFRCLNLKVRNLKLEYKNDVRERTECCQTHDKRIANLPRIMECIKQELKGCDLTNICWELLPKNMIQFN